MIFTVVQSALCYQVDYIRVDGWESETQELTHHVDGRPEGGMHLMIRREMGGHYPKLLLQNIMQ